MSRLFLSDVTKQGTTTEAFYTLEIKTLVSQITGPTGPRKAQLNFAPGFLSAPVGGDRLIGVQIGPALYAIGGNAGIAAQEAAALAPGERMVFSTDSDGTPKIVTRWKADGSLEVTNENGDFKFKADGEFNVNNGNLKVLPNP
jgi:hypothetical protein